jgi:hypothetical protein
VCSAYIEAALPLLTSYDQDEFQTTSKFTLLTQAYQHLRNHIFGTNQKIPVCYNDALEVWVYVCLNRIKSVDSLTLRDALFKTNELASVYIDIITLMCDDKRLTTVEKIHIMPRPNLERIARIYASITKSVLSKSILSEL